MRHEKPYPNEQIVFIRVDKQKARDLGGFQKKQSVFIGTRLTSRFSGTYPIDLVCTKFHLPPPLSLYLWPHDTFLHVPPILDLNYWNDNFLTDDYLRSCFETCLFTYPWTLWDTLRMSLNRKCSLWTTSSTPSGSHVGPSGGLVVSKTQIVFVSDGDGEGAIMFIMKR